MGNNCLGSSSAEKALRFGEDKLNMSQQYSTVSCNKPTLCWDVYQDSHVQESNSVMLVSTGKVSNGELSPGLGTTFQETCWLNTE